MAATKPRPTNEKVAEVITDAIVAVCAPFMSSPVRAAQIAEKSVHEGDWNGWGGEKALAIISLEDGLPLEWHQNGSFERCIQIGEIATAKLGGFRVFIEHVNGGVAAVYPC